MNLRNWAMTEVRITVSALCLGLAVWLMPDDALPQLADAQPGWLFVALAMGVLAIGIMATRLLVLRAETGFGIGAAVTVTWAGQFGAMLGLGLLSADGARITMLVRSGQSLVSATQLIVMDRALGLAGLAILAVTGWSVHVYGSLSAAITAIVAYGAALAALSTLHRVPLLRRALPAQATPGLRLALGLALSVLLHSVTVATFLVAALAIGFAPPLPEAIVAVSIGLFFAILPVSRADGASGNWRLSKPLF